MTQDNAQAKTAQSHMHRKLTLYVAYLLVVAQDVAGYGAQFVIFPLLLLGCNFCQARKPVIHSAESNHGSLENTEQNTV